MAEGSSSSGPEFGIPELRTLIREAVRDELSAAAATNAGSSSQDNATARGTDSISY